MKAIALRHLCTGILILAAPTASTAAIVQPEPLSLSQKLESQWKSYAAARETLIERVGCGGEPITRQVWENLLQPKPGHELNRQDLANLKALHTKVIARNRTEAKYKSKLLGIDLTKIKSERKTGAFCASLPKGGMLHIHPGGTITKETALKILEGSNPKLNIPKLLADVQTSSARFDDSRVTALARLENQQTYLALSREQKDLLATYFALPSRPYRHRFVTFEAEFSYIKSILGMSTEPYDSTSKTVADFIDRSQSQHVNYAEFTKSCPSDLPSLTKFAESRRQLSLDRNFLLNNNCSFARTNEAQKNARDAQALFTSITSAQKSGTVLDNITGIDLLSNEEDSDTPDRDVTALGAGQGIYACRLKMMKTDGLKLHATMHAGELGHIKNVRDAIIMGADRIGHGVALQNDPVALEYARIKILPIEINLVSNVRLKSVRSFRSHPFLNFLRLGLPVSLSTDNEGMFETDINNECQKAINSTDITYAELKQLAVNSIETSFADEATKAKLLSELLGDFEEFERNWRKR